ncbi:MAG: metallopeptidase TldD-related protein, partial [Myxococcota bacterium]
EALVTAALARADAAPDDPHAGPAARQTGTLGGLGIADRRYDLLTADDRAEVVVTAERSVRPVDRRLVPSGFTYRDLSRTRRFANTRGVRLEEVDTTYEAEGTVSAASGGDELVLRDRIESRTFASIASLPYGTTLAQRASDLCGPRASLSGPVRVLFPPLPTARLFAAIAARFDARRFEAEPWFLRPLPNGAPNVDPRLHLQDDGAMPGGLRSASFDDRGVAPVALTLLREGRVDGRFVDPEFAHLHDVRPTGHQVGDALVPRNLVLRSGTRSMNATLTDLGGSVLVVDDLADLSGVDWATGDCSLVVDGVVHLGPKAGGAVRRARLVGNLSKVLNSVVEVCSDTDRIGYVDAPGIVFDGLSVA